MGRLNLEEGEVAGGRAHGRTDLRGEYGRRQTIFSLPSCSAERRQAGGHSGTGSLFLCCLLLGGGMGLVYDGMRLARRILPHGVWAVQIEDGLYWAAVALGGVLGAAPGKPWGSPLFPAGGYFWRHGALWNPCQSFVMAVGEKVLKVIGRLVMLLLTIILTPFRLLYLAFGRPVGNFVRFCGGKSKNTCNYVKYM